jgi:hypothetical protein
VEPILISIVVQHNNECKFYIAKTFHDGFGAGLFIAPLLEYRPADSRWGVMLHWLR